jgi:hypothetical protein
MKAAGHPGVLDPIKSQFVSVSPAVACPRLLGLSFGSLNAPRLHSFAWNLGVRPEPRVDEADFTQYLAFSDLERLAEVYFLVIHPIFNFIDRDVFKDLCRLRYSQKSQKHDIDPIICGVAALGSLYAIGTKQSSHCHEAELVELAKTSLEHSSILSSPTQHHVTAWILRTIYLRSTTRPHASWISSCTTMHIAEATGLHQDVSSISVVSPATPETSSTDSEMRRRLFWVAWSLNKILSYEYGRSPVTIPNSNVPPLEYEDGNLTYQYAALASLLPDPDLSVHDPDSARALYKSLTTINALQTSRHELTLLKADLSFSIYRNLRLNHTTSTTISSASASLVIQIGLAALPATADLAAQHLPWWTVISVPFQLLCVLLAIDSRESLSHVAEAMEALEEVGRCWDTHVVREAVGSASFLVRLSRKRKEEDVRFLAKSFGGSNSAHFDDMSSNQMTVANEDIKFCGAAAGGVSVSMSSLGVGELTPTPSPTSISASGSDSQNTSSSVSGTDTAMLVENHDVDWVDHDGVDHDPQLSPVPENNCAAVDWNTFFNTLDWL